jgi:radical SAM superfamily enzyme YgiQ (UPF0313 family)
MPRLLLVNPWIFDFAACDFWLKPIGLLALASALKDAGFEADFLDLTDASLIRDPGLNHRLKRRPDGRAKLFAEEVEKPEALKKIPRRFKRYGLPPGPAREILKKSPAPDAILVSTTMTYWSHAYKETVRFLREVFKNTPVIAGGLYATICHEHAEKNLGADFICRGAYEKNLAPILSKIFGSAPALKGPEQLRLALELYPRLDYGVLLTGRGCPFRCKYCVGWTLNPALTRKPVEFVVDEILWQARELGLRNIVFYDDALILDPENHIMPILEKVATAGIPLRFRTPNGIHLKPMSIELARLMRAAGFETIRFGLETADPAAQKELGYKAGLDDLEAALSALEKAGYRRAGIGVYLLAGLPGQSAGQIEADIRAVKKLGARPYLSEYSPIPGAGLWEESVRAAKFPIADEPLFQNCTLMSCAHQSLTFQKFHELKALCRGPIS